jgi:hypothetical protein
VQGILCMLCAKYPVFVSFSWGGGGVIILVKLKYRTDPNSRRSWIVDSSKDFNFSNIKRSHKE